MPLLATPRWGCYIWGVKLAPYHGRLATDDLLRYVSDSVEKLTVVLS